MILKGATPTKHLLSQVVHFLVSYDMTEVLDQLIKMIGNCIHMCGTQSYVHWSLRDPLGIERREAQDV